MLAVADALPAVPSLYWVMPLNSVLLLLLVRGSIQADSTTRYVYLAVSMALVGWGNVARGVRAVVRVAKERTFAKAAIALGASRHRVVFHHLLPQTTSYLVVTASVMVPRTILLAATLSFFGLDIRAPSASWGTMMADLMGSGTAAAAGAGGASTGLFVVQEFWWLWLPGAPLLVATLAWVTLGEAVRGALDARG